MGENIVGNLSGSGNIVGDGGRIEYHGEPGRVTVTPAVRTLVDLLEREVRDHIDQLTDRRGVESSLTDLNIEIGGGTARSAHVSGLLDRIAGGSVALVSVLALVESIRMAIGG